MPIHYDVQQNLTKVIANLPTTIEIAMTMYYDMQQNLTRAISVSIAKLRRAHYRYSLQYATKTNQSYNQTYGLGEEYQPLLFDWLELVCIVE